MTYHEPWRVEPFSSLDGGVIVDNRGTAIASEANPALLPLATCRRIVGCVNALEGCVDFELGWIRALAYRDHQRRSPAAWACRICGKIDWADTKDQLAQPEHICMRGVDVGECRGRMIPLYGEPQ